MYFYLRFKLQIPISVAFAKEPMPRFFWDCPVTRGFGVNGSDFLVSVDLMEASGALEKQVNV